VKRRIAPSLDVFQNGPHGGFGLFETRATVAE
jgi:hypothetical protein